MSEKAGTRPRSRNGVSGSRTVWCESCPQQMSKELQSVKSSRHQCGMHEPRSQMVSGATTEPHQNPWTRGHTHWKVPNSRAHHILGCCTSHRRPCLQDNRWGGCVPVWPRAGHDNDWSRKAERIRIQAHAASHSTLIEGGANHKYQLLSDRDRGKESLGCRVLNFFDVGAWEARVARVS